MDIDTLTLDDLHNIVEGMFCFPVKEKTGLQMQALTLDLIEYHESTDADVLNGLAFYAAGDGVKPTIEYDWDHRQRHFEDELGH